MFYTKKYPITHLDNEFLVLEWERGYKNTKIFYKDAEISSVNNIQQIRKGFKFNNPDLGLIELKLSEKPVAVDVIINGLHSAVNNSHPIKKIKSISTYFYMFATFVLIYILFISFTLQDKTQTIFALITEIPFIALYIICAIYAKRSKAWAVYTGFIVFCFFSLLSFVALVLPFSTLSSLTGFITVAVKAAFIIFMVPFVKQASQLWKYKQYEKFSNSTLIDDI